MKRAFLILFFALAGISFAQLIETNLETGIILIPVKDVATHEMLRASLREKDPLVRIQGIIALQTMRDPADEALLAGMLKDPVAAVREQAGTPPSWRSGSTPATAGDGGVPDLRSPNVLKQQ